MRIKQADSHLIRWRNDGFAQLIVHLRFKGQHLTGEGGAVVWDLHILQGRRDGSYAFRFETFKAPQYLSRGTDFIEAPVFLQGIVEREFRQFWIDTRGQFNILHQRFSGKRLPTCHIEYGLGQIEMAGVDIEQKRAREPTSRDAHQTIVRGEGGIQLCFEVRAKITRDCLRVQPRIGFFLRGRTIEFVILQCSSKKFLRAVIH